MHSESLWVAISEEGWQQRDWSTDVTFDVGEIIRYRSTPILAEQFEQDIIADLGNVMTTFVESGQVWALLIGFVLGYVLRGVTTYR